MLRLASEDGTNLDLLDWRILDGIGDALGNLLASSDDQIACEWVDDIVNSDTTQDALLQRSDNLIVVLELGAYQTAQGTTILLADDDVVSDIDQTTGQVTCICSLQRGIGKTLTGTVRRDEVFEGRHTFFEVCLNWVLDNLSALGTCLLRLGHQTTHTGQLSNLILRTTGA